jgi:hypothetical protein
VVRIPSPRLWRKQPSSFSVYSHRTSKAQTLECWESDQTVCAAHTPILIPAGLSISLFQIRGRGKSYQCELSCLLLFGDTGRIQAEAVDYISPLELHYIGFEVEVDGMTEPALRSRLCIFSRWRLSNHVKKTKIWERCFAGIECCVSF